MLALQLERLLRCNNLDSLVVATSDHSEDLQIADVCAESAVSAFRGSLEDVLDRVYHCAMEHEAETVVRLTGDCPLADPELVDDLVDFFYESDLDYASNCLPPTLPDGLDAEVFRIEAIEAAWRDSSDLFEREHVTPFIYNNPNRFRCGTWRHTEDLSHLRWTVDEPQDFEFVKEVYSALYPDNTAFGFRDVLEFLKKRPELVRLNNYFHRNEGSKRPQP